MSKQSELSEMLNRTEDLHPDLTAYIDKSSFGENLRHPMVYSLMYHPSMNAYLNAQYKAKKEYFERAKAKKEWSSMIWIYERPYRLQIFEEIMDDLSDSQYWDLLGSIWSDSENLWQYGHLLGSLINSNRPGREAMMDDDEKEFLNKLPNEIVVYRGHQFINRLGYSWTLSYWRAKWFSQRFSQKQHGIVQATIKKENIIAVLLGRNEYEIIVSPNNLEVQPIRKPRRLPWMNEAKDLFVSQYRLGKSVSFHGPWHWEKVEKNALTLAKATKGADKVVAQLFALIHDSQRFDEGEDPEHGRRAAVYAEELFNAGKLQITKSQLDVLMEACKYHNDGSTSNDPTIGVCWDADRLDLMRVGITPDPNFLSTQAGKDLLWRV